ASGGSYEAFTSSKSWSLGQTNATATVYAKFKDTAGNESSCISDTIIHDDQPPVDPTGLALGSVPPSLSSSPTISFTDNGDNGPAGILKFEIQFHLASDDTIVESWQDFISGNALTGLTLSDGVDYYAKV